jgi:hypothetical protein
MRPRDIAIKRTVSNFEPLIREQLELLTGKYKDLGAPSTIWRRLLPRQALILGKHIYPWKAPFGEKYVYATYDITKRKDFTHDLIITWVQIMLDMNFDMLHWQRRMVKEKNKVNEDAVFTLGLLKQDRTIEFNYYLEADTGSEGYEQIFRKWEMYEKMLDVADKKFSILFVCGSKERAIDLWKSASGKKNKRFAVPIEYRRAFLITDTENLITDPTGSICYTPYEEGTFTILPPI